MKGRGFVLKELSSAGTLGSVVKGVGYYPKYRRQRSGNYSQPQVMLVIPHVVMDEAFQRSASEHTEYSLFWSV